MKKSQRIGVFALLLLFLFSSLVVAQNQLETEKLFIPELDYTHYQLNNGLQIYVFEDHQLPLANFSIWYQVGSIDEPEGLSGISHLLEHNMFLGTDTLKKDQVHKLVKAVGGKNNASTYYDYTQYYEEVPSAKLELAMAIEADRMRNLKFDSAEFKREKQVVRQERRKRIENNVFSASLEQVQAEAFPNSPLNHQVIGWDEDLKSMTVGDLKEYYQEYYAPNNAVMVVSGDVDPAQVHQLAKKYYGDYTPRPVDRAARENSKQTEERVVELEKVTRVPIIEMIYKVPKGNHRDIVAVEALLDILINNDSSRIKRKLKQERRMILEAGGLTQKLRRPGMGLIYLVPMSTGVMEQVKQAFDREIQAIINEGVSEEELQIVKKSALKNMIFNQKHTSSTARAVAKGVVRFNDPYLYQENIKRLKELTEEDIIRAAKKYFQPANRTVGYITPKNNK